MRYSSVIHIARSDKNERQIFQKVLGLRIRQLRKEKKWTQEMLAQEAQINEKYVYDVEVGKKCVSAWVLVKIARALDTATDSLLTHVDDE